MKSLEISKVPIENEQQDKLRTLFASPGWLILREVLSAACVEAQVAYMDASLYQNENAIERADTAKAAAVRFNTTLDVLDEVQSNVDGWYRITIEQRR